MGEQRRGLLYGSGSQGTGPVISGPVMGPPVSQLDLPASSLSSSASRSILLARKERAREEERQREKERGTFLLCASRHSIESSGALISGPAWRASEFRKQRRINSASWRSLFLLLLFHLLFPFNLHLLLFLLLLLLLPLRSRSEQLPADISDALIAPCSNTLVCKTRCRQKLKCVSLSLSLSLVGCSCFMVFIYACGRDTGSSLIHKSERGIFLSTLRERSLPDTP